jgi:hypothetical protein
MWAGSGVGLVKDCDVSAVDVVKECAREIEAAITRIKK